jgi:hypothetical protein
MNAFVIFLLIGLAVVAVAAVCDTVLVPRVRAGATTHGRASIITLLALLITPALATSLILTAFEAPMLPLMAYLYGGYAVGLACFIVLNRRYRDLDSP